MNSRTPEFVEPWRPLSGEQTESFLREIHAEISSGHALHGLTLTPIARSRQADDVLFKLEDGRFADVHLTWRSSPEPPPWPLCKIYSCFAEWAEKIMIPDANLE